MGPRSRRMLEPGARQVNRTRKELFLHPSPHWGEGYLWARGDDEAEAGLGTVVADEGLLDLLAGEPLVLGGSVQQVVEGEPTVVERGQSTPPEVRRLEHLVEKGRRLLLGHSELLGRRP